jgi:hypothetical protein
MKKTSSVLTAMMLTAAMHAQATLPVLSDVTPTYNPANATLMFPVLQVGSNQISNVNVRILGAEVTSVGASVAVSDWLEGSWEGSGYQNNGLIWTVQLTASQGSYQVNYPTLSCSGNWTRTSIDPAKAMFKEVIAVNRTKCLDGHVVVTKIDSKHVTFSWWYENGTLGAWSTLIKK